MSKLIPAKDPAAQSSYQQKSKFTLLIYFRDGYTEGMKFHSFKQDTRKFSGSIIRDQRYALNRLVFLVEDKFKGLYKTAIIYDNETNTELLKYSYDYLKDFVEMNWEYCTNGDILLVVKKPDPKMTKERKNEYARYKF